MKAIRKLIPLMILPLAGILLLSGARAPGPPSAPRYPSGPAGHTITLEGSEENARWILYYPRTGIPALDSLAESRVRRELESFRSRANKPRSGLSQDPRLRLDARLLTGPGGETGLVLEYTGTPGPGIPRADVLLSSPDGRTLLKAEDLLSPEELSSLRRLLPRDRFPGPFPESLRNRLAFTGTDLLIHSAHTGPDGFLLPPARIPRSLLTASSPSAYPAPVPVPAPTTDPAGAGPGAEEDEAGGTDPDGSPDPGPEEDNGAGRPIFSGEDPSGAAKDERPLVALTFDDGPSPHTAAILDALYETGGKATFFPVGAHISRHPELIVRMAAEGHETGNHTFQHRNLTRMDAGGMLQELAEADRLLTGLTGTTPRLIRPPGGAHNQEVRERSDRPLILWSVDTRDWSHQDSARTLEICRREIRDGSIVLMHDLYEPTARAARELIHELDRQGWRMVTVSQLLELRKSAPSPGDTVTGVYP